MQKQSGGILVRSGGGGRGGPGGCEPRIEAIVNMTKVGVGGTVGGQGEELRLL